VNDYGTAEASKLAFQAGADVLLFRRTVSEQQRAHSLLVQAVRSGEIKPARLDASVKRILQAKSRRGLFAPAGAAPRASTGSPAPDAGTPPLASAQTVALDIARQSLTLVKNTENTVPFKLPDGAVVCVVYPRMESIQNVEVVGTSPSAAGGTPGATGPQTLGAAVQAVWPGARLAPFSFRPAAEERELAQTCARDARAVIVGSYNLREYPAQATFLKGLLSELQNKPVAVVALRLPYDVAELGGAQTLLATYSARPASLQAAAEALFGRAGAPRGHLPVPVSQTYPIGFGLLDWSRSDTRK
jgi:beta-N-acetylhexosaminidase